MARPGPGAIAAQGASVKPRMDANLTANGREIRSTRREDFNRRWIRPLVTFHLSPITFHSSAGGGKTFLSEKAYDDSPYFRRCSSRSFASETVGIAPDGIHHSAT